VYRRADVIDWMLSYEQACAADRSVVGDDGWNLARLDRLGFLVPEGGIVVGQVHETLAQTGQLPPGLAEAVRHFLAARDLAARPVLVGSIQVRGADEVLEAIMARSRSTESGPIFVRSTVPNAVVEGVAYSADPRSGRRDWTPIVAGPERVLVEASLVRSEIVERSGPRVLTDAQYRSLARLVARVEWALGDGQDPYEVEWVFDGQLWIARARAIANLPRVTVPLAAGQPALWSNGNLKDAIAGVPTTATWSFVAPFLRAIFFAPIERLGYPLPYGMDTLRRFDGRAYLDLSTVQAVYFDALGALPAEANRALGGPWAEVVLPPPSRRQRARWTRARLRLAWLLLGHARTYPRVIRRARRAARRLAIDLSHQTDADLIQIAEHVGDVQIELGQVFQMGNVDGGVWPDPLARTIERWLPGQGQRLASALMAGSGGVVSAEHGYRMIELAAIAAREGVDPCAWPALPRDSRFRRALKHFLDEFGHRGVYEAELANPRWIEDPSYVLEQIQQLIADGRFERPDERARYRRRAAELELRSLPLLGRLLVLWLAGNARAAAARREAGKSAMIAMALPVRRLLLEFGRRLVRDGLVDQIGDVFHLSRADLEALERGEWDGQGARALVAERRALRAARLAAGPPPDLIVVAPSGQLAPAPANGPAGGALRGVGAAAGRARGPARLIHHPHEGGRLQRGDILVAPSTDPGWTPLFLRSAALVTEVGGYLSHGAIVAREYGLPAVVNVPRVLDLIADGEIITVDGDAGLVLRDGVP
jgi:rifampicin phosphotransferase